MVKIKKDSQPIPARAATKKKDSNSSGQDSARERALDETLAETFPASDPLSSDPAPGPDEPDEEDKIAS